MWGPILLGVVTGAPSFPKGSGVLSHWGGLQGSHLSPRGLPPPGHQLTAGHGAGPWSGPPLRAVGCSLPWGRGHLMLGAAEPPLAPHGAGPGAGGGPAGGTGPTAWPCPGPCPRLRCGASSGHPNSGHAGGALWPPRHFLCPAPGQTAQPGSAARPEAAMAAQAEYHRLEDYEEDSPPGEEELLVHVTEGLQDSWHHIKNLDNFFTKIYHFHQKNGFACMMLSDLFELVQFLFVVTFSTFLLCCVEYDVLFANRPLNHSQAPAPERSKVTLPDAILPAPQCAQR
uniref:Autophagy-related protein 9 n=1 Tax=Anser cygnoides TaxID=8845 RepID=A0A8B9DY61_ANSCY